MTWHTEPLRDITATLRIEVDGERDERDPYRHRWVTRLRFGELRGAGANTREAAENLADELRALASCPEAVEALAMVRARAIAAREQPAAARSTIASYDPGSTVEVRLTSDDVWVEAEYQNVHAGSMHAVWLERSRSTVVLPDDRVRPVNRPSLADVG